MEKPAPVLYEIHPLLKRRWSPRAFSETMIDQDKLNRILEAARWSPSARNEQPWRFIIGKNKNKIWQKIFDGLIEFNQKWSQLAPILILVGGRKSYKETEVFNPTWKYDVGQAVAHLTFQAMEEGIFIHQMSGLDQDKMQANFSEIDEDFHILTVLAMGYPGKPEQLEERIAKAEFNERTRLKQDEIIILSDK